MWVTKVVPVDFERPRNRVAWLFAGMLVAAREGPLFVIWVSLRFSIPVTVPRSVVRVRWVVLVRWIPLTRVPVVVRWCRLLVIVPPPVLLVVCPVLVTCPRLLRRVPSRLVPRPPVPLRVVITLVPCLLVSDRPGVGVGVGVGVGPGVGVGGLGPGLGVGADLGGGGLVVLLLFPIGLLRLDALSAGIDV